MAGLVPAIHVFRLQIKYVARMKRSEIPERLAGGSSFPGLRCAPSELRDDQPAAGKTVSAATLHGRCGDASPIRRP
jgi:hypothetical protein